MKKNDKKKVKKKLVLAKETLRELGWADLQKAAGGIAMSYSGHTNTVTAC